MLHHYCHLIRTTFGYHATFIVCILAVATLGVVARDHCASFITGHREHKQREVAARRVKAARLLLGGSAESTSVATRNEHASNTHPCSDLICQSCHTVGDWSACGTSQNTCCSLHLQTKHSSPGFYRTRCLDVWSIPSPPCSFNRHTVATIESSSMGCAPGGQPA